MYKVPEDASRTRPRRIRRNETIRLWAYVIVYTRTWNIMLCGHRYTFGCCQLSEPCRDTMFAHTRVSHRKNSRAGKFNLDICIKFLQLPFSCRSIKQMEVTRFALTWESSVRRFNSDKLLKKCSIQKTLIRIENDQNIGSSESTAVKILKVDQFFPSIFLVSFSHYSWM